MLIEKEMYTLEEYIVNVRQLSDSLALTAKIEFATREDMPTSGLWKFAWQEFWDKADFKTQYIVKMTCNNSLIGLLRYAVYTDETDKPYLLEILHLETIPKDERLYTPIGRWLVWYATQVALKYCVPDEDEALIYLDSLEDAIEYYGDIIKMEPLGWVTISPDEAGYAFRFTIAGARNFCNEQTRIYGNPTSIKA